MMPDKINLKKIEIEVFTSSYEDGLMDILIGIVFSQFAIAPLLTDIGFSDLMASAIFVPLYILILIIFILLKKYITNPRMGTFKPNPKRKFKLIKLNLVLFILLLIGFLAGLIYNTSSAVVNSFYPLTFSSLVLIISFVAGYYLNINRLFYYGILVALSPLIGELLWSKGLVSHHGFPLTFGISSAILIIFGITKFIRFCHDNPLPIEEE
jgi:hypothetical protein